MQLAGQRRFQVLLQKLAMPVVAELKGQVDTVGLVLRRHERSIGEIKAKMSTADTDPEKSVREQVCGGLVIVRMLKNC